MQSPYFLTIMDKEKSADSITESSVVVKFVASVLLALITGVGSGAYYSSRGSEDAQLERRLTQIEMRLEQQTVATTELKQSINDLRQSPIFFQQKKGK